MAVRQGIQISAGESPEPGLVATSTLDNAIVSSVAAGERRGWARYVLAVLDEIGPAAENRGARLAIDSDLPATGGLSSSSALSVGCLIALSKLWGLALGPQEIVARSMAAEQAAAIAGGAMDQTVITLARPGHALRIEFDPPSHRHIPMPEEFTWVAGYSGTRAAKAESAAAAYNSFVLASRAAAALLAEQLGRTAGDPPLLSRVGDASPDQIAALPRLSVEAAAAITGGDRLGLDPGETLNLRMSAEHVLSEAARVDSAERAVLAADGAELGRLMNASHASLRKYGASTEALDAVVAAAGEAGAVGARLTGAGFGGWAIALTSSPNAAAIRDAMKAAGGGPTFIAQPGGGALWSLHAR